MMWSQLHLKKRRTLWMGKWEPTWPYASNFDKVGAYVSTHPINMTWTAALTRLVKSRWVEILAIHKLSSSLYQLQYSTTKISATLQDTCGFHCSRFLLLECLCLFSYHLVFLLEHLLLFSYHLFFNLEQLRLYSHHPIVPIDHQDIICTCRNKFCIFPFALFFECFGRLCFLLRL